MKKTNKILSVIMALIMVMTIIPMSTITASAAISGTCGDNVTWAFDEATGTLAISGAGDMKNYYAITNYPWGTRKDKIKSVVVEDGVTGLGDYAFAEMDSLTDVTLPESITEISTGAFANCDGLTGITLPDSITSIEYDAFYQCSNLKSITIPDGVTTIGYFAFTSCTSLESAPIPDSVTSIGGLAFAQTGLKSVTIPGSVTFIEQCAFAGCTSLTEINVDENNLYYSSDENGVLFNKEKTILMQYPAGNTRTKYVIPYGVVTIDNDAFFGSPLTEVIIPDSVTMIIANAFYECTNLTVIYYSGTEDEWKNININDKNIAENTNDGLLNATISFGYEYPEADIYNLGEETYAFNNFGDTDSPYGHCFGMSMTSSGYHLGILDITDVGGNKEDDVNALSRTDVVKAPICHYQGIQGWYYIYSTVAGGNYYSKGTYDVNADWEEITEYVSSHEYDDTGALQICMFNYSQGGHAVNFLRYEVVDGQERIYIYDNNFPSMETYLYQGADGKIYQAPFATLATDVDKAMFLVDVADYFSLAGSYDATRYIYADASSISVQGAVAYDMCAVSENGDYTMFALPEDATEVTIVPLIDNATFVYCDKEFTFGEIDEKTVGTLVLASSEETAPTEAELIVASYTINIQEPSRTEIRNKDGIILHAVVGSNAPDGSYVRWESDNGNFDEDANGNDLTIIAESKGYTTFTAILCAEDGKELARDTVEIYSKSGFFDKIGGFFRSLFGSTKIYEY